MLSRLETNSDVDPTAVELDKKKFSEMKNMDQSKEIANREVSEILSRFDRKIKDPRSFKENKKTVKIIRDFLKINCSIDKLEKYLNDFVKSNDLSNNVFKDLSTIKLVRSLACFFTSALEAETKNINKIIVDNFFIISINNNYHNRYKN